MVIGTKYVVTHEPNVKMDVIRIAHYIAYYRTGNNLKLISFFRLVKKIYLLKLIHMYILERSIKTY